MPGSEPCREPWSSLPSSPGTSPQPSPMSGQCMMVTGVLVAARPSQGTAKVSEVVQGQGSDGGGGVGVCTQDKALKNKVKLKQKTFSLQEYLVLEGTVNKIIIFLKI